MGGERVSGTQGGFRWLTIILAVLALTLALAASGIARASGRADAAARRATLAAVKAGTISTVAGGVGGPASAARVAVGLDGCMGVAASGGFAYVAGDLLVRRVSAKTGALTTPAGTGLIQPLGDGRPATRASVAGCDAATDQAGNVLLADTAFNRIRVIAARKGTFYGRAMKAGDIYTIVGNGTCGFSGDGGQASKAELCNPDGIAVDHFGNVVVADTQNSVIRVIATRKGRFYGRVMKAGSIYAVAGDGSEGFSGDGGPATSAGLPFPGYVAVDASGNLVIADTADSRIRVVAARSGRFYGRAMTAGDIYTIAGDGTPGFSGDGGPATSADLNNPGGVALDNAGNVVIADSINNRVRVVAARTGTFYGHRLIKGNIYTIAGKGSFGFSGDHGPATRAELGQPDDVAVDSAGDVIIADTFNGRVRVLATRTGSHYGQEIKAGDLGTIAGNGTSSYSGDGRAATTAQLGLPQQATIDARGDLVIADTGNNRIRVVAARSGTFYGRAMTAGHIYTVAGTGQFAFSAEGGLAAKAKLAAPKGVTVDAAGNLVIADTDNHRVRVVAIRDGRFYGRGMTAGHIYTVAGNGTPGFSGDGGQATSAELQQPYGVAFDASKNLLIADNANNRIRVVTARTGTFYGQAMTAGHIYTVAGDADQGFAADGVPATSTPLDLPGWVTTDRHGNLVIADTDNVRIRVVAVSTGTFYGQPMTAGDIYTVAGNGGTGFSGTGGPATSAELGNPAGVAVDKAGNLVIADTLNHRIRVVAVRAGTFYGQAMTAGDIYTVAGNRGSGYGGDAGPATKAELDEPTSVTVLPGGGLLITDSGEGRIRRTAA